MTSIWQPLFANLALISILLVAWDMLSDLTQKYSTQTQSFLLGMIMAGGAIASMASAQALMPGFLFDLRSPLIAAAAFFGGVPAALVAGAGAIAYRLYLGGQGAGPGVIGILIAGSVGYVFHWITRRRQRTIVDIFGFGAAVAGGSLLSLLTLPSAIMADFFRQTWLPLSSVTLVGCVLIGILLHRQFRRRELVNANMIYRAMVRELPDCLNAKDTNGVFVAANPATAALMRAASADDLIGKTDFNFYPRDLAEQFRRDEEAMMRSGDVLRVDQPALFPDGSSGWLSTLKVPFHDDLGNIVGIITYNRDITEQKRNGELKNEFISTVSHELRTPLTSIRGSLGLIAAGVTGQLPLKMEKLVRIAHLNSERLVQLVNDILDLEKIESGKMEFAPKRMPIRPILEQAIAANASYLPERRIGVVLVDDAPAAEAILDPDRLHQVLANLLSNAVKFSPVEETVTVRLQHREEHHLRISVIDRGAGIPDAFRSRIFGRFEQADGSDTRATGGTGLGLSIVKSLVEKLGGTIGFESEAGKGTTFHIDLPKARLTDASRPAGTALPGALDRRSRVLICEDDPATSMAIAANVDAGGFSSDVAPDISSAKALLRTRDYIAMTLDTRLVGDPAISLFRDIRLSATNRDVPVFLIDAAADSSGGRLLGSAITILDWLEKPVDPERLHTSLSQIVARTGSQRPRILHVEDDEGVLDVLSENLGADVSTALARTLREARYLLAYERFDLMVLDVVLPDGSGLDLFTNMAPEMGVIMFSAATVDTELGQKIAAAVNKSTASELDIAGLVRRFVPLVRASVPDKGLPAAASQKLVSSFGNDESPRDASLTLRARPVAPRGRV